MPNASCVELVIKGLEEEAEKWEDLELAEFLEDKINRSELPSDRIFMLEVLAFCFGVIQGMSMGVSGVPFQQFSKVRDRLESTRACQEILYEEVCSMRQDFFAETMEDAMSGERPRPQRQIDKIEQAVALLRAFIDKNIPVFASLTVAMIMSTAVPRMTFRTCLSRTKETAVFY